MPSKKGTFGVEKWPVATITRSNSSSRTSWRARLSTTTVNFSVSSDQESQRTTVLNWMYLRTSLFSTRPRM